MNDSGAGDTGRIGWLERDGDDFPYYDGREGGVHPRPAETAIGVFSYELLAVERDGEYLYLRIKHFDPGLKGWEEKDSAME